MYTESSFGRIGMFFSGFRAGIVKFRINLTNGLHFNTDFPPSGPSVSNMRVLRVHLFLFDNQRVMTKTMKVCNIFAGFPEP